MCEPARYIGKATAGKCVSKQAPISAASTLVFKWCLQAHGLTQTAFVRVRANTIKMCRVPFPCHWRRALQVEASYAAMYETAKALTCGCTFNFWLSAPQNISIPPAGASSPGKTLMLMCPSGRRIEHILCAHIRGHTWYCHPGTLSSTNPFHPRGLVAYDIHQRAWRPGTRHRVRLRGRPLKRRLGDVALRAKPFFEWAVAVATWRAEEVRSVDHGGRFDMQEAMAGIDIDVLNTRFGSMVAAVWQWQTSRDGSVHRKI